MKNKIQKVICIVLTFVMALMCFSCGTRNGEVVIIDDNQVPLASGYSEVSTSLEDEQVIPDKYNTGAQGELTQVQPGDTVCGVTLFYNGAKTKAVLDFCYKNKGVSGTVVFENYDFSSNPLTVSNEKGVTRNIKLIFNNCRFGDFSNTPGQSYISYEFNNCTFAHFAGSNSTFNRCYVNGDNADGMNPYNDVYVYGTYICDLSNPSTDTGANHTDGIQIYGYKDVPATNITYSNCRFELPELSSDSKTGTSKVNTCIMVQLEASSGSNINFENCYLNGGGYSMYAWSKNPNESLTDTHFNDIHIGGIRAYGLKYSRSGANDEVSLSNVAETEKLYVSSVWSTSGEIHMAVSNDTLTARKLFVVTDTGSYSFEIPACPDYYNSYSSFETYPFDKEYVVSGTWAVCYDATGDIYSKIRFVNYSEDKLYRDDTSSVPQIVSGDEISEVQENGLLKSGKAGDSIYYSLYNNGKLILSGEGCSYDYNDETPAPWGDYADDITAIVIRGNISSVGSAIFKDCVNLIEIVFPEGIKTINAKAMYNCSSLTKITLPISLIEIKEEAFSGMALSSICYSGTNEQLFAISIADGNEPLTSYIAELKNEESEETEDEESADDNREEPEEDEGILISGSCGGSVKYVLTDDGVLNITGTGATANYNSKVVAPWKEYSDTITKVHFSEGIDTIGQQFLRDCSNVTEIVLPSDVKYIKANAFMNCKSLEYMYFPASILEIGDYAFSGTGLILITVEDLMAFDSIVIGNRNDVLFSCMINIESDILDSTNEDDNYTEPEEIPDVDFINVDVSGN